jgi:hypothetical protein
LAIKLEVARADLQFEAVYPQPDFGLFRDESAVLHHLFKRLEPHGLRLSDVRIESGSANVGEQKILCHLFNYWMTIKLNIEKIEVVCAQLPRDHVEKFNAAILDVLRAVKDYRADLAFKAFTVGVGVHAKLEGQPGRDYLARFAANIPQKLGPSTGNGAVFYFGPEGDRMLSSVTADVSAVVQDAVWLRIHGVWDARKVTPDSLPGIAAGFVRQALESLGLQLPV